MLKIQEIRELIRLVDQSNIEEFVFESDGTKVKMKKPGTGVSVQAVPSVTVAEPVAQSVSAPVQPAPQAEAPKPPVKEEVKETGKEETVAEADNLHKITSPMVGTFYSSPNPDAPVYVKPGDKITNDTVVCIVEAMKLFNEIEAEVAGEVVEVLVKNGQLVEYGQPLFLVKPE
ncbi:acetyl-CoA carboxylase biotin carboxyl carrier protein [Bacillus sp. HMF5848]|uniref:acetyl-CoA carboxylase biotin carboxyl carrier protein n=1 Tax=Bacillus sp. HMF5848 TaxID=2495421 RepID=UPI000F78E5B5|nr:acetyl-CoA carboxylase biotin carboxyl carrier protein [Bacillus sp. HMF5848]RSK27798.1 acetyl-CoA carboxylase biotin carboxyl carrier protein [Bacillus sp. HMF5848]